MEHQTHHAVYVSTRLKASVEPVWTPLTHPLTGLHSPSVMQLIYQNLPPQLRRGSRFRKVVAVVLAAYAVRKLSPFVWRKIQVRRRLRQHTHGNSTGTCGCIYFINRGVQQVNGLRMVHSFRGRSPPISVLWKTEMERRRRATAGKYAFGFVWTHIYFRLKNML